MKVKTKYILFKKSIYKKIITYNFSESLDISKKRDKQRIGVIKFYDDKTINRVIKNSIDNRFKKILELMASCEESDSDPSEGLVFCLDEVAKFKREIVNKYAKFLKKKELEFNNKKIEVMEKEIKNKLIAYRLMHLDLFENKEEMEEEINRRR